MTFEEAFREYERIANPAQRVKLEELRALFNGSTAADWKVNGNPLHDANFGQGIGGQTIGGRPAQGKKPPWSNAAEMNEALAKQRIKNKPKDPALRIKEINRELDIIRGRVATPKGYNVDPLRAKRLMAELKQLQK